ncbi:CapA family protein [Haloarcula litorea]|uniref:CapA family protein n=1 Tax=Haloarcula litorea TaxID=3032579 RepID=UPI0023E8524D|nr:CapA family protein [Halomicroarcula sp. GDY20]
MPGDRRRFLRALGTGVTAGLAGCARLTEVFPESGRVEGVPQAPGGPLTGRVRDTAGDPVGGARVAALGAGGRSLGETTTDGDGWFSLDTGRPVWLRVTASGHVERVVAATPGTDGEVVLVGADGTAALAFGGDVMVGRRFYEPPSDDLNPRGYVRPSTRRADHERTLAPIEPLLGSADLTSINLESPLTTASVRHPEKSYTFTSHPVAADALAGAGVDYAALGNNHAFDALHVGLADTTRTLDSAGIAHSGAGQTPQSAWEPATADIAGVSVALLSCSDLVGGQYDLHWSADRSRGRPATITSDGQSDTVPAGAGVAEAGVTRIGRRVERAGERADVVVVQLHGGEQYRHRPTDRMRRLTDAAVDAGADLVVNHHPHVVGGVERRRGAVVAWSLGNLVFDQRLWPTFPTYLLTAYVTREGVVRWVVDPLLIDGFVPHGVVGKPNRTVAWRTAGRSGERARVTASGLAGGGGTAPPTTTTVSLDGGAVYARRSGWIRGVETGTVRLGRDLLPTGTFESVDVDETGYDGPLWRFSRNPGASGATFGVDGSGGVRLRRISGNSADVVLSNSRRIPVDGPLTVAARYRTDATAGLELDAAWYAGTSGSSIERDTWTLAPTGGEWGVVARDLVPPDDATHANVVFSLSPPDAGTRTAYVDEVRLVQWADRDASGGRSFDHVRTEADATVTVGVPAGATADWRRLDGV